ncbi:hypothetical protein K439DRAFT_1343277 [Ramaria rubella]|nr:hypothetical protein K439DRAFT_1343277 [Ramaria rubella]
MPLSHKMIPWEVIDHKVVSPVWNCSIEDNDLNIIKVSPKDLLATYLFEVKEGPEHVQRALVFAQQQVLNNVSKNNYNILLMEGWEVTTYRKGAMLRVKVKYHAWPAQVSGDVSVELPPFFDMLRSVPMKRCPLHSS